MGTKLIKHALLLLLITVLSACSGSSNSNSTTTITGIVAVGYISGANVCLDINTNMVCDVDEPSTVSVSGGSYSLTVTNGEQDLYPVVAEIVPGAIDENAPSTAITNQFVMSSLPGKYQVITPLTTLVHAQYKRNPAMGFDTAEVIIKQLIGFGTEDHVSLFEDYIAGSQDTTASLDGFFSRSSIINTRINEVSENSRLQDIARAIGVSNSNNTTAINNALPASTVTEDVQGAVSDIVNAQITTSLDTIVTVIDSAATVDQTVIDIAAGQSVVDTSTVETVIAIEQSANTIIEAPANALFEFYFDFQECGACTTTNGTAYTHSYTKYSVVDGVFFKEDYVTDGSQHILDATYRSDSPRPIEIYSPNGWAAVAGADVVVTDGRISFYSRDANGNELAVEDYIMSSHDVNANNIADTIQYYGANLYSTLDGTEHFPAGSVVFPLQRQQINSMFSRDPSLSALIPNVTFADLQASREIRPEFSYYLKRYSYITQQVELINTRYALSYDNIPCYFCYYSYKRVYFYSESFPGLFDTYIAWGSSRVLNIHGLNFYSVAVQGRDIDIYYNGTDGLYKVDYVPSNYTFHDISLMYNKAAMNAVLMDAGISSIP